jgi:phosphate transport system substrate-binding protein
VAAALAVALAATACGGNAAGSGATSVVIDGSSTVAPLSEAVAERYQQEGAGVTISVGTSGTGGGFSKFCAGETDISNASRPITEEEAASCAANGISYLEIRVGLDALAIVTSATTGFVECLSLDQLGAIFAEGGVSTWDQVDPGFPAEPLAIFAPGTDSGTYDFFVEEVLGPPGEPDSIAARRDYTASEDDNTLVQGIAGQANSWGFLGLAYVDESAGGLEALAVSEDAGGDCVAPEPETVRADTYPLGRPLFIYVDAAALAEPAVADFVAFYLDVAPELTTEVGYIPAAAADYERGRREISQVSDG